MPKVIGLRTHIEEAKLLEQSPNPKDAYGLSKVPLSLIPRSAKIMMAMGLAVGDMKYGAYNWRVSKVKLRVYHEALERHNDLMLDGEEFDRETGLPHICLLLANAAIICDGMYGSKRGAIDDRPVEGNAGDLMVKYNDITKSLQEFFTQKELANARLNASDAVVVRGTRTSKKRSAKRVKRSPRS